MLKIVYCDRLGCGKEVGAQRIENGKVVEEEYVEGTITDGEGHYYCGPVCDQKKDEFLGPEEIEDE